MYFKPLVDGFNVCLLLSLVSLVMMLLAVVTQVSEWWFVSIIFVSVLLVKFVSEFSLLFVCSVDKLL